MSQVTVGLLHSCAFPGDIEGEQALPDEVEQEFLKAAVYSLLLW